MSQPAKLPLLLLLMFFVTAQAGLCYRCEAENTEESRYCVACGARLADSEAILAAKGAVVGIQVESDLVIRLPKELPALSQKPAPRLRGSGFVISADGLVVTTSAAIRGWRSVWVLTADGVSHGASVVGDDRATGIALLRMDNPPPPALWGETATLELGSDVTALGLDEHQRLLVAPGVIAADGRRRSGFLQLEQSLIFDAAVKLLNSGGVLIDETGRIVGMTLVREGPFAEQGRTVAIPAEQLRRVTEQLLTWGTIRRPWLGLVPQYLSGNELFDEAPQTIVRFVLANSPAELGGLLPGDELLSLNGEPFALPTELLLRLLDWSAGEQVALGIRRDGVEQELTFTLGSRPQLPHLNPLDALEFHLGLRFDLSGEGLVPLAVLPDSPGEGFPLDRGTVTRLLAGADFDEPIYNLAGSEE
ncbi:S1C family serine protease, partial [bacterium]|nr:S1C family serine protease [bacterium]